MSSYFDGIAWIIAGVLAVIAGFHAGAHGQPSARAIDGDTFEIAGERVRIRGVDTPELKSKGRERELALRAKEELQGLLTGSFSVLRTGKDKYGRTVADVVIGRTNVADLLIEKGLGRPYLYKLPQARQDELTAAQCRARAAKVGIWEK